MKLLVVIPIDFFFYELAYVFDTNSKVVRLNIKIDKDLHYVLVETNVNPSEIYVSVQQFRHL